MKLAQIMNELENDVHFKFDGINYELLPDEICKPIIKLLKELDSKVEQAVVVSRMLENITGTCYENDC